jgi:HSP20 family protein
MPSMNFKDKGDKFVLTAEVPGVKKEDFDISISDSMFHLKAESGEEMHEEGECYVCQERTSASYHRSMEFPEEIDSSNAKVTLENGVLTVDLPKKETTSSNGLRKLTIE